MWFDITKMSQNEILIGCLAKTGQDQYLKLSPQSYILFSKVFLTRNIVRPPGKYPWQGLFMSPRHSPFFKIWDSKLCPSWVGGGGADTVLNTQKNLTLSSHTFIIDFTTLFIFCLLFSLSLSPLIFIICGTNYQRLILS